ncbi:tetratricopeptide repeat protein [Candidatus Poribacteria bacterium]|nr:tetratricopeptide repeat protein [Candidatus Poribacteria bacterium]
MRLRPWLNGHKGKDPVREHFEEGIDLRQKGKWQEAIEQFSEALILSPSFIEARIERARAHIFLGKWDEAIADFSEVLLSNPQSVEALEGRASAYALKANEIAERYQQAGVKQHHLNIEELLMDLPLIQVAPDKAMWIQEISKLMKLDGAAIKDAEEAIKLDPNNKLVRHLLDVLSPERRTVDASANDSSGDQQVTEPVEASSSQPTPQMDADSLDAKIQAAMGDIYQRKGVE